MSAGANPLRGLRVKRVEPGQSTEIDDLIPDCHAAAILFRGITAPKYREG
jgi:hypothetical protein